MYSTDSSQRRNFNCSIGLGSPCGLERSRPSAVSGESVGAVRPNVLPQVELDSNQSCVYVIQAAERLGAIHP